ncbi:hypothetical protein GIB67_012558 [Kingdonia uniflora]|uniref:Uncharacterized protein n=1 Tax=Kingdonia uniflora TaxID=39325 RepID=A0A7J7NEL0_9MAGN|nr:hypothetical protein GIB67_012558 [Kingdonia uniflora]
MSKMGSSIGRNMWMMQELRRRRLQINAKSKVHNKKKENVSRAAKGHGKDPNPKYLRDEDANLFEESSVSITKGNFEDDSSLQQEKPAPKKRQKLHWGYHLVQSIYLFVD